VHHGRIVYVDRSNTQLVRVHRGGFLIRLVLYYIIDFIIKYFACKVEILVGSAQLGGIRSSLVKYVNVLDKQVAQTCKVAH
jgi:hypothetical protein